MTTEGWDGIERRRGATDDTSSLRREVSGVRQDLGRLATAVATLGSDEKLQQAVDSVVQEERRHRQRIMASMVVGLVVVAAISIANRGIIEDAGTVADYVQKCLQHPERLTPEEKQEVCGSIGDGQEFFIKYFNCVLLIEPADRTPEKLNACIQSASQTTSTTGP